MYKAKKTIAAFALASALALATTPAAFAADATVNDTGTIANDGTASTTLNVYATTSQIIATIPIDITVVSPAGGGVITAPSSNVYKITNNGTVDIKVDQVQGVDANGWKAVKTLSGSPDSLDSGTVGELALTVQAGSAAPLAVDSSAATSVGAGDVSHFTVSKDGGTLGLTLAGKSLVKSALTDATSYGAIKIKYTVSASA